MYNITVMSIKLPTNLKGILWSKDINKIDPKKDKSYIIHQIFAYGGWEHLKWVFKNYSQDQIKNTFIKHPAKDYSERSFNFVQKVLLKIPDNVVDKRYYVKTFPRIIR
ncbi:MAG: hypothetical protein QMD92_00435 [bacterium]|nr:hypothetical protein [bacterium]